MPPLIIVTENLKSKTKYFLDTAAFQFYAADFLADANVSIMSNQGVGCYIKLICFCWREGFVPAEIGRLARLCGEDSSAMAQIWPSISPFFAFSNSDCTKLVHPRLEKERTKQETHRKERSKVGIKGANSRWTQDYGVISTDVKPVETSDG